MFGLFIWLMLFISGIAVYRIIHLIQKARLARWLKTHGTLIMATVTNVQKQVRSEKSSLNEKMWAVVPHSNIIAQWRHPKTQQVYTFEGTIRGPLPRRYKPGHQVHVLINPDNPRHYHMEV
jgi:hypothetical protein